MGKFLIIPNADFSAVAIGKVTPITGKKRVIVVASPIDGGVVSGGGLYNEGETVQISATAKAGFIFDKWNDGDTNSTRTVVVSENVTYTAAFKLEYIDVLNKGVNGYFSSSSNGRVSATWEKTASLANKYVSVTIDGIGETVSSRKNVKILCPVGYNMRLIGMKTDTLESQTVYKGETIVGDGEFVSLSSLMQSIPISSTDYPYATITFFTPQGLSGPSITADDLILAGAKFLVYEE